VRCVGGELALKRQAALQSVEYLVDGNDEQDKFSWKRLDC
jgi:hypothetical protein